MQQMMKKMGIQQVDIPAQEVIIRTEDKEIVIRHPQVAKVNMMGQETYQVVGEAEERTISTTPTLTAEFRACNQHGITCRAALCKGTPTL